MSDTSVETIQNLRDLTKLLAREDAFVRVCAELRKGRSATIDGAWGSSKSMALAGLALAEPALLVAVVPHPSEVDALVDDLRTLGNSIPTMLPALEGVGLQGGRVASVDESFGRRLAVLKSLSGEDPPRVLVTSMQALLQPVPTTKHIRANSRLLERGKALPLDDFLSWLGANGWSRRDAVELPGEFSLRGGILDLFPIDAGDPLRIEFFGDEVESIREFSIESQRSLREIQRTEITVMNRSSLAPSNGRAAPEQTTGHFAELVPRKTWFALVEPAELKQEAKQYLGRLEDARGLFTVDECWARLVDFPTVVLSSLPYSTTETTCSLRVESVERFSGEVARVREELDRTILRDTLLIACHNEAERKRLGEILNESEVANEGRLHLTIGHLTAGFRWHPEAAGSTGAMATGFVAISDHQLFQRTDTRRTVPKRRFQGRAIDSFIDLIEGDYVVHLGHGIGIFRGMKMLDKNGQLEEHLRLEFADNTMVYVPASKIDLVQKYVGSSQAAPRLSKIGGLSWESSKKRVEKAVQDLASDLIDVQASRQAQPGFAYPADSEWQKEFEAAFPYVETDDQLTAIEEIRRDMENARPMDRLICGDVGYGKTELAMRATFKAIDSGKQVAVLAPTTVLAQQHLRTFRERMAEFPFIIECVSRFQTRSEQNGIIKRAAEGSVDVLIGTHRLLSADVKFHDLGMVIIDEEQRFGVAHKERLKSLRSQVDLLTMTATPIPRTLHSALLGIRDISNLETPPQDRLAIETRITRFDPAMIRHAVLRELNRDGQVYFVHNRVQDIGRVAQRLLEIVPEARVAIIHGQMAEDGIEEGMLAFLQRRADILIATTIIESGLDIPNANTIFINEGDRYGLAELHQLRGRVGRSTHRAYCYVMVDEHKTLKPDAQRRLKAIEEYSSLGAGFQIALRDLEIRGAGNILGTQQSGHIAAVGYELYCHLLDNAVRRLKRQPLQTVLDVTVELPWKAYLPPEYLPGERFRIDAYRRLARVRNLDDLEEFRKELEDRFGPVPQVADNLIRLAELRILSQLWQIEAVRPDDESHLVLSYRDPQRIETLRKLRKGELIVADRKSAYIRVPPDQNNSTSYYNILKRILQPG